VSAPQSDRKWSVPGEAYLPPSFLLLLVVVAGLAAIVMLFTDNAKWGLTALVVSGITTLVWVVTAAVGAARSGVPFLGVVWMSIKNLVRIVFDFIP
jgi:hypothetical protein